MNTYELLRASHTKRWTIVSTARTQTVAEHLFNVTMIAEKLAEAVGYDIVINSDNFLKLQTWALMHDLRPGMVIWQMQPMVPNTE